MLQLVWVPDHIDCGDLPILDFKGSRLQLAIGFQRDKAGQSVDESGTNKLRAILPEKSCQILVDFHDGLEADDRLNGCRALATTVGIGTDIGRQHRTKRFHVAAARGVEESLGKLETTLFLHLEARSRLADMSARSGSKLAAGSRVASDGGRDFLESQPKHIVQQEGSALE